MCYAIRKFLKFGNEVRQKLYQIEHGYFVA